MSISASPSAAAVQGNSSPYNAGAVVTLTCSATGGLPTPTLQWSKNSVTLSGETSGTLSFTSTASSGGDYRCIAANNVGSVTSDPATIIINCKGRIIGDLIKVIFFLNSSSSRVCQCAGKCKPLRIRTVPHVDMLNLRRQSDTHRPVAEEWGSNQWTDITILHSHYIIVLWRGLHM